MTDSFKFPQSYLLLWAPFMAWRPAESGAESFRRAFLELFERVYEPERLFREFPRGQAGGIPEIEDALRDMDVPAGGRGALIIWCGDETPIRIEAGLYNARVMLGVRRIGHIICFIEPTLWSGLVKSPRALVPTSHTCVIEAPANVVGERPPLLTVRVSLKYDREDSDIFAGYLKGDYPPERVTSKTKKPPREGETTIEFAVEDMLPGITRNKD